MGFLRTNILYLLLLLYFLTGCGRSIIELIPKNDNVVHGMFGGTASRNFFVPVTVSDSLILKWESESYGSFRNSSVTIYGEYIFTSDLGGRIFVFNFEDGKKVGMLKSSESIYSAPVLIKSLVIYAVVEEKSNISQLIYYDHNTGDEEFYTEIEGRIISEIITLEDGIIVLSEEGDLYRYNLDGDEIWKCETNQVTRCSPSLLNNIIVLGNDIGEILSVNLNNGKIINRVRYEGIFTGAASIDGNHFYMSNYNGNVYALNLNSLKLIWEFNTGTKVLMTPAFDDEFVIVGNLEGTLYAINKENGMLIWKENYGGLFNASPILTNNRIIIPDLFRSFHIIDKNSGRLKKSFKLNGRVKLTPVYYNNTIFIGYDRGMLRAYEFVY